MLVLTSVEWSFHHGRGHHQNAILLAALAMMFGRSSPLSLDSLWGWARRREPQPSEESAAYRWPVLLGQLAVALMLPTLVIGRCCSRASRLPYGNRYFYEKTGVYWLSAFVQDSTLGSMECVFDAGMFCK